MGRICSETFQTVFKCNEVTRIKTRIQLWSYCIEEGSETNTDMYKNVYIGTDPIIGAKLYDKTMLNKSPHST